MVVVSALESTADGWCTEGEYSSSELDITPEKFLEVTNLLLENPNVNSTHLFRADILFDSARLLKTIEEKENDYYPFPDEIRKPTTEQFKSKEWLQATTFIGFTLERTVVRRLIPRNPNLDDSLLQTCRIYKRSENSTNSTGHLVVYYPHSKSEIEIPWYHPAVKALAYKFESKKENANTSSCSTLSIHFLPFSQIANQHSERLHRTFLSLLKTFIRLARYQSPVIQADTYQNSSRSPFSAAVLKDTILPQHIVQNTYTKLKQKYASDLMKRWIEKTDPSKHVFEDLSIAAFLIELWKQMYRGIQFPGFVDIACGNGVLTYILIQEGFKGYGFDARKRKTWDILGIDQHLHEKLCIPNPFFDALENSNSEGLKSIDTEIHLGTFPQDTFIISNHADELTLWTPIMAKLSNQKSPLPFLAIPCCSHALSGAKHRYPAKGSSSHDSTIDNPASGDLKAIRDMRIKTANHSDDKSTYACLTKKVVAISEEIGCSVELTLMRIPSTRNIGIVGNRHLHLKDDVVDTTQYSDPTIDTEQIEEVIHRECKVSGGIGCAATIWVEKAQKLQTGIGRGKLNLGGKSKNLNM